MSAPAGVDFSRPAATARAALERWGIADAELTPLREGENVVFRVDAPDGARYALRVHRPDYQTPAAIRSEHAWMGALAGAGVRTPPVVPTRDGDTLVEGAQPCALQAWVDGEPLGAVQVSDPRRTLPLLGGAIARLHAHARVWEPPAGFERPAWDADGLVGAAPRWGPFEAAADWEPDVLRDVQRARDAVRVRLAELGTGADAYGLIHADMTAHNILMDDGDPVVLDFDDCGPGWYAYDLAVALQELELSDELPALRDALLGGYRAAGVEPPAGAELLPAFFMARRLARLGWMGSRPGNQHARLVAARVVGDTPEAVRRFLRWAGRR